LVPEHAFKWLILCTSETCVPTPHTYFPSVDVHLQRPGPSFSTQASHSHHAGPENWYLTCAVVNAILFLAPISGFDQALAEVSSTSDTHIVSSHQLRLPRIEVLIDWWVCSTDFYTHSLIAFTGRQRSPLEIRNQQQASGERRACAIPEQMRSVGCQVEIWHTALEVRPVVW